jgi:hypothetical protein
MIYNYSYKNTALTLILIIYFFIQNYKSQFIFSSLIKIPSYNTTLFNGLLLIHPICLYLSYSYILYIKIFLKNYNFKVNNFLKINGYKKYMFITTALIALALGC